jgi:hypothetical protein
MNNNLQACTWTPHQCEDVRSSCGSTVDLRTYGFQFDATAQPKKMSLHQFVFKPKKKGVVMGPRPHPHTRTSHTRTPANPHTRTHTTYRRPHAWTPSPAQLHTRTRYGCLWAQLISPERSDINMKVYTYMYLYVQSYKYMYIYTYIYIYICISIQNCA